MALYVAINSHHHPGSGDGRRKMDGTRKDAPRVCIYFVVQKLHKSGDGFEMKRLIMLSSAECSLLFLLACERLRVRSWNGAANAHIETQVIFTLHGMAFVVVFQQNNNKIKKLFRNIEKF